MAGRYHQYQRLSDIAATQHLSDHPIMHDCGGQHTIIAAVCVLCIYICPFALTFRRIALTLSLPMMLGIYQVLHVHHHFVLMIIRFLYMKTKQHTCAIYRQGGTY